MNLNILTEKGVYVDDTGLSDTRTTGGKGHVTGSLFRAKVFFQLYQKLGLGINLVQHKKDSIISLPINADSEPISRQDVADRLLELKPCNASNPEREMLFLFDVQGLPPNVLLSLAMNEAHRDRDKETGKVSSHMDNSRPISLPSPTSKVFKRFVQLVCETFLKDWTDS